VTDDSPVYRDLLRFKPNDLSPNAWAVKAGVSRTVWADMRRHGNPSRRTLEKLLNAANSSLAEFEALRLGGEVRVDSWSASLSDPRRSWTGATLPALDLIASEKGEDGRPGLDLEIVRICSRHVIDRLQRPASLAGDPNAFAITVVGEAMRPRFRPGQRIAVSPGAPISIGDDVFVRLGSTDDVDHAALIAQLVGRTEKSLKLRQFHPDRTVDVDAADIAAVQKIPGELI